MWRNSFLDAFAQKGWASTRAAVQFRFQSGSLADYALKKLNLLTAYNPKMDEYTKISLIVIGLPYSVQEKIDPESVTKLLSKINSFERQPRFTTGPKESRTRNPIVSSQQTSSRMSNPCSYCISKGFTGASHEEAECRTKKADRFRTNNDRTQTTVTKPNPPSKPEGKYVNVTEFKKWVNKVYSESKNK